jgi:hypothetical protein
MWRSLHPWQHPWILKLWINFFYFLKSWAQSSELTNSFLWNTFLWCFTQLVYQFLTNPSDNLMTCGGRTLQIELQLFRWFVQLSTWRLQLEPRWNIQTRPSIIAGQPGDMTNFFSSETDTVWPTPTMVLSPVETSANISQVQLLRPHGKYLSLIQPVPPFWSAGQYNKPIYVYPRRQDLIFLDIVHVFFFADTNLSF